MTIHNSLFLFLSFVVGLVVSSVPLTVYECSSCLGVVDNVLTTSSNVDSILMKKACQLAFPDDPIDMCSLYQSDKTLKVIERNARKSCQAAGFCPAEEEAWKTSRKASGGLDIRVSKALGSRGYDKVRLSVISNHSIASEHFSYSAPFKYRWTQNAVTGPNYLNTGIVSVTPGQKTRFTIEGQNVDIFVPKENDGVRGLIVADPCFTSQWILCQYAKPFDLFNRMTGLMDAIVANDDVHYYQILGDNFYDQDGNPSATFFSALSPATKSKMLATVPGNHDFWVNSAPPLWVPKDQQGQGFMQFYGQDVIASKANPAMPYDFSVDPDGKNKGGTNLPLASNFMSYNKVGNVGFIAFSGAHSLDSQASYLDEACSWASNANVDSLFLLGHWNNEGYGCPSGMTTPEIYDHMLTLPSCTAVAGKMKYFEGHKHCNIVVAPDVGFMVGAMGMSDSTECGGEWGIPIVDTTGGKFSVYYFRVQKSGDADNYDAILSCVKTSGVSNCYHLATTWSSVPL